MELPEIQKRRFMLHFDLGLTYEQIGAMEGCTKMPIKRSIDSAIEKIRLALKNFWFLGATYSFWVWKQVKG